MLTVRGVGFHPLAIWNLSFAGSDIYSVNGSEIVTVFNLDNNTVRLSVTLQFTHPKVWYTTIGFIYCMCSYET